MSYLPRSYLFALPKFHPSRETGQVCDTSRGVIFDLMDQEDDIRRIFFQPGGKCEPCAPYAQYETASTVKTCSSECTAGAEDITTCARCLKVHVARFVDVCPQLNQALQKQHEDKGSEHGGPMGEPTGRVVFPHVTNFRLHHVTRL